MENKPPVDRSLLIPLLIGLFSVFGICFVLLALRLGAARAGIQTAATPTPQKYVYLGTEPFVVFPTDLPTPTSTLADTPTAATLPADLFSLTPSRTLTITATVLPGDATRTPTPTSTSDEAGVLLDDVDSSLVHTGNWIEQSGLSNAYKNTLHISTIIGNSLQVTFYGDRFGWRYQAGPSLGTVAIHVTNMTTSGEAADFTLDQSASTTAAGEWESPLLATAYHTVAITHISGGSINVDAVILYPIATPTPTSTPTVTRTP